MRAFSFFSPINIFLISQFLVIAQVKVRCQWCKRGARYSMRAFSFFGPKIFFSISRTGERDVSTGPTRLPEQYGSTFLFLSKKFFFDISISGGRTGESEVSAVLTRYPERFTCIFVFKSNKFFLRYLAKVKGMSAVPTWRTEQYARIFVFQSYQRGAMSSYRAFSFFGSINFASIS